ncbi:MAG: enoyl-CoA hydratase/isomerase family protein [Rhodospirillales bacterium]|nr:MAG: enoyl-CoA hydratase/isomerase family protein [Rhodospirillales bacterium]
MPGAAVDDERSEPVVVTVDGEGTGWLILNRPAVHNAFDDTMIAGIGEALHRLAGDRRVRTVAIRASGESFSAGADLNWMARLAAASQDDNVADALALARMLDTLDRMDKPTLAIVQGPAYGGGLGLIAACDVAIAADTARFALTEVRLGLIPATIAPYVIAAIGARQVRRYALTAEPFDAAEAMRIGLVHRVVPAADLDAAARSVLALLAAGAPGAQAAGKALIRSLTGRPVDEAVMLETAQGIAAARASAEAQDRIAAFLARRRKQQDPR